ncbi:hypothetical protein LEP1GSC047_2897 [Leptospira inadai serovar Lyme str. 10]|uniref:Uncharacterized protein n=1 Tax=Leptospira inadai serovar Lyme str. 10 TaxID=1049790 RepID=V6HJ24_9LEPT|nr:hypothetical protein LEP1GSC047_2897 [Leptospira inadai serovar Lyme str. 10]
MIRKKGRLRSKKRRFRHLRILKKRDLKRISRNIRTSIQMQ